jgi:hypothetical protein
MHDDLWGGAVLKATYANFFLQQMSHSFQPHIERQRTLVLNLLEQS